MQQSVIIVSKGPFTQMTERSPSFLKKRKMILAASIALVVLVGSLIWAKINPVSETPSTAEPIPQPNFLSLRKSPQTELGTYPPQERSLPVFSFNEEKLTREQIFTLAGNLDFKKDPQTLEDKRWGTIFLWSEANQTLAVRADGQLFNFAYNDPEAVVETRGNLPSVEEAQSIVLKFLEAQELESSLLIPNTPPARYLELNEAYPSLSTANEAHIIEVQFLASVGNYPLITEEGSATSPVVAWVDRGGRILKLDYYATGEINKKIGDYPLRDTKTIKSNLDDEKAVVVYTEAQTSDTLQKTKISEASLAYIKTEGTTPYLEPIYVFEGLGDFASAGEQKVILYLPAITEKLLRSDTGQEH